LGIDHHLIDTINFVGIFLSVLGFLYLGKVQKEHEPM